MTIHLHSYLYSCSEAQKFYKSAKLYLARSKMARMIIEGLETSEYDVNICVTKHCENIFKSNEISDNFVPGGCIVWDPENSITVVNRENNFYLENISPAMALLHEMSHAYQTISEPRGYVEAKKLPSKAIRESNKRKWGIIPRSKSEQREMLERANTEKLNRIEQTVVDAIEHTVARELNIGYGVGVEGVRVKYGDIFMPTSLTSKQDFEEREKVTRRVLNNYLTGTNRVLPGAGQCLIE